MRIETAIAILANIFAFALVAGLIFGLPAACKARWEGHEVEYGYLSGCRVKINGQWFPEERVRAADE